MNILLLMERSVKDGQLVLLQHQAILSIARAILASPEGKGMVMSEHKVLVPAYPDVLALLAVVANDYSEQIEPENERVFLPAPFVLYRGETKDIDSDIDQFSFPRWFDAEFAESDLNKIIYNFKPEVCLMVGAPDLKFFRSLDFRFKRMIGFSSLMRGREAKEFYSLGEMTMADDMLQREMDREVKNQEGGTSRSFWESLFADNEDEPELEPYVAFGSAIEMAMFMPPDNE